MPQLGPVRSICVFCGARAGNDSAYAHAARATAHALADRNLNLVYGGGNVGLMGILADAALERAVHVTGVIPVSMVKTELAHKRIQRLITVESMHERKAIMARECDAIIVLPGGVGTLDELFEAMTWNQLRLQRKPIGILDLPGPAGGFYDALFGFLRHAQDQGFVIPTTMQLVVRAQSPAALVDQVIAMGTPVQPA